MARLEVQSNTFGQWDSMQGLWRHRRQPTAEAVRSETMPFCLHASRAVVKSEQKAKTKKEAHVRHLIAERHKRIRPVRRLAGYELGDFEIFSLALGAALWIMALIVWFVSLGVRTGNSSAPLLDSRITAPPALKLLPQTSANWRPLIGPPQQVAALQDARAIRLSEEDVPLLLNNMPEGFERSYRIGNRFSPVP